MLRMYLLRIADRTTPAKDWPWGLVKAKGWDQAEAIFKRRLERRGVVLTDDQSISLTAILPVASIKDHVSCHEVYQSVSRRTAETRSG